MGSELYHHINMKFLVALSVLVTMAYADADPYLAYGYHGYAGLGYLGYAGLKSAPCVNAANVPVPCAAGHYIGKREAEADPYLAYGYAGLGYPGLKSAPCVNAANVPVPCAAGYLGHYYGKREADADPALIYSGIPYGAVGAVGYPYAAGYPHAAYGYAAPALVAPHTVVAPAVLGTEDAPNPFHSVAATPFGLVHSSLAGICTNVKGEQVDC